MLNAQEGQTYICTKSDKPWWTRGKEYEVASTTPGLPCLVDDDGDSWELDSLEYDTCQFKLKYKSLDLNKLTVYQLKEYADLQQAMELAESELDKFIERSKQNEV